MCNKNKIITKHKLFTFFFFNFNLIVLFIIFLLCESVLTARQKEAWQ